MQPAWNIWELNDSLHQVSSDQIFSHHMIFFHGFQNVYLLIFCSFLENVRTCSEKSRVSRRSPRGNGIQSRYQCSGSVTYWYGSVSVTYWYGSGSTDSCLWLKNPAPDPGLFVSNLQDTKKKYFFAYYFLNVHLHHSSKIKILKEVTNQ